MTAGQTTSIGRASARAIAFDLPHKPSRVEAADEAAACTSRAAQLGSPLSGSGLLKAAADKFIGPFSPEHNARSNSNAFKLSEKNSAHKHSSAQPEATHELVSAFSLRIEEPRAMQKARKTTKGNVPTLLKSECLKCSSSC